MFAIQSSSRRTALTGLLVVVLTLVSARPTLAADATAGDEAVQSALFVLRSAMQPRRDGKQNSLLRSLRQLRDPALQPFFTELAESDNPSLRVHGILGLAETHPQRQVDLKRLAALTDPAVQAEAISALIDSELLTQTDAAQLITWQGLDQAARILASSILVQHRTMKDLDLLREGMKAESAGRRGMAALLLLQCGDETALPVLQAIQTSNDPRKDQIRDFLLSTAVRLELDAAGPWAMQIASDAATTPRLSINALRVAMRFGVAGSIELWQQRFKNTTDPAERMRLTIVGLNLATWMAPESFDPILNCDEPLLKQLGKISRAIAAGEPVAEPVIALLKSQELPAVIGDWVLLYCKKHAREADSLAILAHLLSPLSDTSDTAAATRNRAQRIDDAVSAAQLLVERYPDASVEIFKARFTDPKTDPSLLQGILVGLIRADSARAFEVVADNPPMNDLDCQALWLLLRARVNQPLDEAQMRDLATMVRGGGILRSLESLRVQAAWIYLKRMNRTPQALAALASR